jgi:hypothetical protein
MALHFNYTKCTAPEGLTHDHLTTSPDSADKWHPVGESLVWLSLLCDFGKIEDVEDVWKRISLWQALNGAYMRMPDLATGERRDVYITRKDVETYKGLTTNVTTVPFKTWAARVVKNWVENNHHNDVGEHQSSAFEIAEQFRKPESLIKKEEETHGA